MSNCCGWICKGIFYYYILSFMFGGFFPASFLTFFYSLTLSDSDIGKYDFSLDPKDTYPVEMTTAHLGLPFFVSSET